MSIYIRNLTINSYLISRKFIAKYFAVWVFFFSVNLCDAATISPWGDATLKNFDILAPGSGGLDLVVDGDLSYLASQFQGLYILDTSDLNNITVKHQLMNSDFGISGFSLYSIVKHGNYLYCAFRTVTDEREGYIKVVNLTNLETTGPVVEPDDIFFYGYTATYSGQPTGLFLDSDTQELFVALRVGGIGVIDVSIPSTPVLTGKFYPGLIEHQQVIVDKSHNRAYFGGWFRGVGVIDITDPDPVNWVEYFVDDASATDRYWYLAQMDQYLYVPIADSASDNTFDEGLAIFDLTNNFSDAVSPPVRIGFAAIPPEYQCESATGGKDEGLIAGDPSPHQIYLRGDYAIVANGCMGIAIFDVSNPNQPLFVKEYQIPEQVDLLWSAEIVGNKLIAVGRSKSNSVNNDIYVFTISPVTFAFTGQNDVPLTSLIYSDTVVINGLGVPTDINIAGGEYSINNASFTVEPGVIDAGDTVQIRLNSSANNNTETTAILTIGGVSESFTVITHVVPEGIAYWQFDEGSGADVFDSTGESDGMLAGSSWATGVSGSALDFDGVSNHVVIENSPELDITGDKLTLSAWIYPHDGGVSGGSRIISKRTDAGGSDVYSMFTLFNKLRFRIDGQDLISDYTFTPNQWLHVTMVYDGVDKRIYINGVLDTVNPQAKSDLIDTSARQVHIGAREGEGRYFNGLIDEIRIYDVALSAAEIAEMDSDSDGLTDYVEVSMGTNINAIDTDADGVNDGAEVLLHATDPLLDDTDDDGFNDLIEINAGSDPLNALSIPADGDINNDGAVNLVDLLLAIQITLNLRTPTANEMLHGDVAPLMDGVPNPDGIFNSADLLVIQRKILGLVSF